MNIKKVSCLVAGFMLSVFSTLRAQDIQGILDQFELGNTNKAKQMIDGSGLAPDLQQYLSANLLEKIGKGGEAQTILQGLTTTNPKSPWGYIGILKGALNSGNFGESENMLAKVLKLGKKSDLALRTVAMLYGTGKNKDVNKALEIMKKAQGANKKSVANWMAIGDLNQELGNAGEATRSYDQALLLDPNNSKAYYKKGSVEFRGKIYEEAIKNLRKSIELDPNNALAYRDLGEIYYLAKYYKSSAESYEKYASMVENNFPAKRERAKALFLAKDYEGAETAINEVRGLDSTNITLERLGAYTAYERGNYPKAMTGLNRYFGLAKPEEQITEDFMYYGRTLNKLGQDSAGVANLKKAFGMDSTRTEILDELADAAYAKKNYKGAVEAYKMKQKAVKAEDFKANDWFKMGAAYYGLKEFSNADACFVKLIELTPTQPLGYQWRARAAASADPDSKAGKAKPFYDEYIAKAEGDAEKNKSGLIEGYSYLSYYHYLKGDKASSKKYADKVLTLDPNNKRAQDMLKALASGAKPATTAPATDPKAATPAKGAKPAPAKTKK